VAIVYWPAVHGGFVFDDDMLLSRSQLIQAGDGLRRIWLTSEPIDYWPITNTAFWLEWRLWGTGPTGYHLVNVALHAACALTLWGILRRLDVPGAFWAAALFALHPLNVQSVAWIAQLKNTLALFWSLIASALFLRSRYGSGLQPARRGPAEAGPSDEHHRDKSYWLSVVAFTLAMLSKGSVAMLPAILLLIVWWQRGTIGKRDLVRVMPFIAVALALTAVNLWFQGRGAGPIRDLTLLERVLGAGTVIWFYLGKAVAPVGLLFMYPQWQIDAGDWRWWIGAAAAVAVTVVLWRRRRKPIDRALLVAWFVFCAALVPVMGLTDVYFMKYSAVADHYAYAALIGVAALVAAALASAPKPLRSVGPVCVAAVLAALTWRQAHLYANGETLYRATLSANPSAWALQNNLGALLIDAGRDEEGAKHLREALRLNADLVAAHNNLCLAAVHLQRFDDALVECAEGARNYPGDASPRRNLGIAFLAQGRLPDAERQLEAALSLNPADAEAHYNLAHLLRISGRLREAVPHYREVVRLRPDSIVAREALDSALRELGDTR
jgi:tetratricopeptide (TPR) repeat protein